jgi:hypothetical protein
MKEFFNWNPIVPAALLSWVVYRGLQSGFRWSTIISIVCLGIWLVASLARLFSPRLRALTADTGKRKPLSVAELTKRLGPERLAVFAPARFGGVIMSEEVRSGRHTIDLMVRDEPDSADNHSGWYLGSTEESTEHGRPAMFDCREALRVAPEMADYLHLPPGTRLVRTGARRFEPDPNPPKDL